MQNILLSLRPAILYHVAACYHVFVYQCSNHVYCFLLYALFFLQIRFRFLLLFLMGNLTTTTNEDEKDRQNEDNARLTNSRPTQTQTREIVPYTYFTCLILFASCLRFIFMCALLLFRGRYFAGVLLLFSIRFLAFTLLQLLCIYFLIHFIFYFDYPSLFLDYRTLFFRYTDSAI